MGEVNRKAGSEDFEEVWYKIINTINNESSPFP